MSAVDCTKYNVRSCTTCHWQGGQERCSKVTDDMSAADDGSELVDRYDCPECGCETEPVDESTIESHLAMKFAGLL